MDKTLARKVFSCIDNTTLNATDNEQSVADFCRHTLEMSASGGSVAAVCVYPRFVDVAAKVLQGSGIKVASVAGAFPHGQLPLELKVAEVQYAVRQGADEVDIVINRGAMLAGDEETVVSEVRAMKQVCDGRTLKVIIETCDLPSPTLVARAAQLAIDGGADFIKTSTGKGAAGATPENAEIMLRVIAENVKIKKKMVGFKAAGGISNPEEAIAYAIMAEKIMGVDYVNNQTFRIGASRLTNKLYSLLTF
ncbi:MAG: deoxyribose-phosphate aldolase [Bacteroidales bacterium]|nr:deoxyribose-phosphate aldolase [Bacteroidales bacterium]